MKQRDFMLAGCTPFGPSSILPSIALFQGAVDRVVSKVEQVDDKILADIEAAEGFLAAEQKRIAGARCKMPFTALLRYALSTTERAARVKKDCNLVVTGGAVMVVPVVPKAMGEAGERLPNN